MFDFNAGAGFTRQQAQGFIQRRHRFTFKARVEPTAGIKLLNLRPGHIAKPALPLGGPGNPVIVHDNYMPIGA